MSALDPTKKPTADEVAAFDYVMGVKNGDYAHPSPRTGLLGEIYWLVGREIAIAFFLGAVLVVVVRRSIPKKTDIVL
jgi:hypothetical protein